MISAKVIADSKNEFGNRITTMIVTFPRIILAEFNTHRMFSRNSASSRAIPFEKMVKAVEENPFIPLAWQRDHKGMQGVEYFNEQHSKMLKHTWLSARDESVERARGLHFGIGTIHEDKSETNVPLTKQLANRLLEPFMYHTAIVTATEWENFFALRCPQYEIYDGEDVVPLLWRSKKDVMSSVSFEVMDKFPHNDDNWWRSVNKGAAEIHMMALAEVMYDAYNESIPKELKVGEWHIPFGDKINEIDLEHLIKSTTNVSDSSQQYEDVIGYGVHQAKIQIATARCARVSYTVVGEEEKQLINEITEANIAKGLGPKWETEDYHLKERKQYENDIKLHDRLAKAGHWSPFEHCAQAMGQFDMFQNSITEPNKPQVGFPIRHLGWSGNFRGFIQYRKTFENECKK